MDIDYACETGNLDWLKAQKAAGAFSKPWVGSSRLIQLAAANGHLDVVKWLVFESRQPSSSTEDNNFAVRMAAANGHLNVVRWLVEESGQAVDLTAGECRVLQVAAEYGHLEVVKWLVKESGQQLDITTTDNYAARWAAANGHDAVLRWLIEDSGQLIDCRGKDILLISRGFDDLNESIKTYLIQVRMLQEALGLDNWKTGLDAIAIEQTIRQPASKTRI